MKKELIPTTQVNLRFPIKDVLQWKQAAREAGISLTAWMQRQLSPPREKIPEESPQVEEKKEVKKRKPVW